MHIANAVNGTSRRLVEGQMLQIHYTRYIVFHNMPASSISMILIIFIH